MDRPSLREIVAMPVSVRHKVMALHDALVAAEAEREALRAFMRSRFILPSGRCTECGIVGAHQAGCEVATVLATPAASQEEGV